ncbi:LysR family transcriptional regulator [Hylemonella gracilis]|uniref:LysR family transcriptional regulator n=1 Tax=Hylemonella gracilis TaxID=80880 RepID=A0A4P6UJP4_9BURK|nr:LysR substrate-binding domain-containing protein [Hylemonella gracilis]QBK05362.1 LysR family transcriptional regulator [Hylemonella gracilis]
MELRHLRYFVAVADAGSLSRAAEKLYIAQPPLSLQIRQLEEAMGTPLFTRHPKGVRLTPAGEVLLVEARALLERAGRMRDLVNDAALGPEGVLNLGYVPSASSTVLPNLVRRLRRDYPRWTLKLREMISSQQVEGLIAGTLDAGIGRLAAVPARLLIPVRVPDPFCLAVPAHREPPAPLPLDLRHCADETFVSFTRHHGPAYFDRFIRLCTQAGFSPRIHYEATTVHGVLDLVGADLGVALVPASTALLRTPGVVWWPLRRADPGDVLGLIRRRGDAHPLYPLLDESLTDILQRIHRQTRMRVA